MKTEPPSNKKKMLRFISPFLTRASVASLVAISLGWTLTEATVAAPATTATGSNADWTSHAGTLTGTRYSELSDINTTTIGTLAAPGLVEEYAIQT